MPFGDRGWRDSIENYCDGYVLKVNGSTATSAPGAGSAPVALYAISITVNPSVGSGQVDIIDSSATANADTTVWSVAIPSAASQVFSYEAMLPRGLALNNGLVITATTITGSISLLYKQRYN